VNPPELRAKALAFLARREHSRGELARKLKPHAPSSAALETVLNDLAEQGLLSDRRFAEQYTEVRSRKYGSLKVEHELRAKGVENEIIAAAVAAAKASEYQIALSVWEKKYAKADAAGLEEKARQMRFLRSRGFSEGVIQRVLWARERDRD
jgi:regulatory protein